MNNYISTLYSHEANFDIISNEVKKLFPQAEWDYERRNEFTIANLTLKSGFLQGKKKLKISYRERDQLGFELSKANCPVTSNLTGMHNLVQSIQTKHAKVQSLLLEKIKTINSEFSITMVSKAEKEFHQMVKHLAFVTDAIVFAQPRTGMMNSLVQGWLDKEMNLILDMDGESNVETLEVKINSRYVDSKDQVLPEQVSRKNQSELQLRKHGLKVNESLPSIATEEQTTIRSATEIAERIVALALTNLVAFNNITGEQALQYANKHEITNLLTPKEVEFLKNPTEESKNHETWKCEAIWTLCWSLGIIERLEFPDQMADLSKIPSQSYPIGSEIKPAEFLKTRFQVISKSEILDMNDLYYRMDWACVDARLRKETMKAVHPGVVYERHYALNWLINYKNQDWDHVSTDT